MEFCRASTSWRTCSPWRGIEIEGIEKRGANFDNVVVAQIKASAQHPNADRLSVCQVDDGSGQTRQIVCGAKNYKVGDKVPLALPGAVLANDLKIKPSKLRGVESQGMLCSPSELGLSQDSDGLLILSPDARIGEPIAPLFPGKTRSWTLRSRAQLRRSVEPL